MATKRSSSALGVDDCAASRDSGDASRRPSKRPRLSSGSEQARNPEVDEDDTIDEGLNSEPENESEASTEILEEEEEGERAPSSSPAPETNAASPKPENETEAATTFSPLNIMSHEWSYREENLLEILIHEYGRNWTRMTHDLNRGAEEVSGTLMRIETRTLANKHVLQIREHYNFLLATRPDLELDKAARTAEARVAQGDAYTVTNASRFGGGWSNYFGRLWLD